MIAGEPGTPAKPLPIVTEENRPFWEGGASGELRVQRCTACGHLRHPVQPLCPRCLSPDLEWVALSGRGEVFAQAIYHRAFHPAFAADVPYNLVLVQLDEGPRMYSNVVDCPLDQVRVGARVEACFDEVADGVWVPRFRLAASPTSN
jgi:uncharacterized protein